MDELQFKVSAELKNILGRDLITNDNIAILELVKNSYDAHASNVILSFENDKITIADNGKGMTLNDLINKWLFVGYSAKRDGTEDESYRNKIKRNFAGAKGIGRISCDKLAKIVTLITKNDNSETEEIITVDWSKFEHIQKKEFDSIPVLHLSRKMISQYPNNSTTGTILCLTELHSQWDKNTILDLKKSLEKMINPFSGSENFTIKISTPDFLVKDNKTQTEIKKLKANFFTLTEEEKKKIAILENSMVNGVIKNSIVDVLKLKTTQIESRLEKGSIKTILSDRGVKMYEIEEHNKFLKLEDVTINLYYMNRAAKYSFSLKMGVQPVRYGNIFLFRNGFRIWPYGEFNDDSWGLNQRAQQGYNRYLGTRDLFGRVDVETNNVDDFKEVSSRDGGLIKNKAAEQLYEYFDLIHHRLERYVAGVLWGEAFLKKDYFIEAKKAQEIREKLQEEEKDSNNINHIYANIGSRVDFLQLVKSLVNDSSIVVKYYNQNLADVVSDISDTEIIQTQFIDDLRKVAEKTKDDILATNITVFEHQLDEIRRQKVEAEKKAQIEHQKAEDAKKKAAEEERRRREEEVKRKTAEKELNQKTKQNLFLQSIGSLDVERILKYHHDIRLQASTIKNTLGRIMKQIHRDQIDTNKLLKSVELISRANSKIISIAQFATKANFNIDGESIDADIIEYIAQYVNEVLPDFYGDCDLKCETHDIHKIVSFKPLEVSLIIDNLISNSLKAEAKSFNIEVQKINEKVVIIIVDDGKGISCDIKNPNSIFEKGVTTTDGSGLGLFSVADFIKKELGGIIHIDNEYHSVNKDKPGFKLIIEI